MTEQSTALTRTEAPQRTAVAVPVAGFDAGSFELMQRLATLMSRSSLVPEHLRKGTADENLANCFLVVNQANRWGMDPFAVAQATSVIGGKLCYEGKLVAAVVAANLGVRLSYEWNDLPGDRLGIEVSGVIDGKKLIVTGTVADWKTTRAGSPWVPSQHRKMLAYRGAREWARLYAPEVMLGVVSPDEIAEDGEAIDITPPAPHLGKLVRGPTVMVVWQPGDAPENVPVGEFGRRALAFIGESEPAAVPAWAERNRVALREFWTLAKDEALAIKAAIEKAAARQEQKAMPLAAEPPPPEGPPDDGGQDAMAFAEPDDRETVIRDAITEASMEKDPAKRRAIFDATAKARESMTDEQVARLRTAFEQMEQQAGKPRGRAAA